MTLLISILVIGAAIAAFIGGISLIHRSEKDHHESIGCTLMVMGVVFLLLSIDSTLLVTLKSCVSPMGQASVYRAPDATVTAKKVTWSYPSDAHNVVWVVVSVDYLNDKPVPRESFAIMAGAFGAMPEEFTLPQNMDMDTVETITVFYGNTKGPSGESVIVVNEPTAPPTPAAAPITGTPAAGSPVTPSSGSPIGGI